MNLKFWKRQTSQQGDELSFVPVGAGGVSYNSLFAPVVARCVALYHDLLLSCPLKAKKEDDLYKLLTTRPIPWMSLSNFYQIIIERYFIFNGAYFYIKTDKSGMIKALLPLNMSPGSLQAYPSTYKKDQTGYQDDKANDWSDAISIYEKGYYFKDYRGRRFAPDEVLQIRSASWNTATGLVEQENIAQRVFNNTFEAASKLEGVLFSLTSRDLRGPLLLTGMGLNSDNQKASIKEQVKIKKSLEIFFREDSQASAKGILGLPAGYDIKAMSMDQPSHVINTVNDIITSNICNIFNVPRSLVFTSGQTERDTKEARRLLIANGLKSFCKILTDQYNYLSGFENEFSFQLDHLRLAMSDIREEAAIAQLVDILGKDKIKEMIEQH